MHKPSLEASTTIKVGLDKAKAWFLALNEHPEWYQFESHAGFTFTEGEFGEPGARFQTEESLLGIRQWLKFELTEVNENRFTFHLREPIKAVWGYFELEPTDAGDTRLRLAIGSDKAMRRVSLKLPGVRTAVQRQITREVENTRASMEAQCSGEA